MLDPEAYVFLMASLLAATDRVANTTGLYGAYLKWWKSSTLEKLRLSELDPGDVVYQNGSASLGDAGDVRKRFDVVYLDPPYNSRQYGSSYHVLNTLVKYNKFDELRGVTGMPPEYVKSDFSKKEPPRLRFGSWYLALTRRRWWFHTATRVTS